MARRPGLVIVQDIVVLALTLGPLIAGCGRHNGSPTTPSGESTEMAALPSAFQFGQGEAILGQFQITIDPVTMSGEVHPLREGQGATQGFNFDLSINQLLKQNSLELTGVGRDSNGDVAVTFTHAHPFPAPTSLSGPATNSNRADLGYTGRLVLLATYNVRTFFASSNPVKVSVGQIVNADGYVHLTTILGSQSPAAADTFPYMLLADEAKDNRFDTKTGAAISNGGKDTGNYLDNNAGWQASNIGSRNDGWTGYDFIHQGQSIRNTFSISKSVLGTTPFNLNAAILVKYCDPRGGATTEEKNANRLPSSTADPLKFAYRLPHAALDISKIKVTNDIGPYVPTTLNACGRVSMELRDWDGIQGEESTDDTLFDDPDVHHYVPDCGPLTNNQPSIKMDAPDVTTSTININDDGGGSGQPGEERGYRASIKTNKSIIDGQTYPALIRISDPEGLDNGAGHPTDQNYHFGLDPVTLTSGPSPVRETYQMAFLIGKSSNSSPGQIPQPFSEPCEDPGLTRTGDITFDQPFDNSPTSWSWRLPPGVIVIGPSNQEAITFNPGALTPGIYEAQVGSTNATGFSGWKTFTFNYGAQTTYLPPAPNWTSHVVDGMGDVGRGSTMAVINGVPMIAYMDATVGMPGVKLARALTAVPNASSDWRILLVDPVGSVDNGLQLIGYNNKPVIAYFDANTNTTKIAVALNSAPLIPPDWAIYPIKGVVGNQGRWPTIAVKANGLLAVGYVEGGTLTISQATNPVVMAPPDWTTSGIWSDPNGEEFMSLKSINGFPAVAWRQITTTNVLDSKLKYARATTLTPSGPGQWVTMDADPAVPCGHFAHLEQLGPDPIGFPVIGYHTALGFDLKLARATAPLPSTANDWQLMAVDVDRFIGIYSSMTVLNHRIALASQERYTGEMRVAYALVDQPNLFSDFMRQTAVPNACAPGIDGMATSLGVVNNTLASSYYDTATHRLMFARAQAAYP